MPAGSGSSSRQGSGYNAARPLLASFEAASEFLYQTIKKAGKDHKIWEGCLKLRVATVCSGTDSPIVALNYLINAAKNVGDGQILAFVQVMAVEIVPLKQAFIRRNSSPMVIFRDVIEISNPTATQG